MKKTIVMMAALMLTAGGMVYAQQPEKQDTPQKENPTAPEQKQEPTAPEEKPDPVKPEQTPAEPESEPADYFYFPHSFLIKSFIVTSVK